MCARQAHCRLNVEHLKTHSQFQQVLSGRQLALTEHFALHANEGDNELTDRLAKVTRLTRTGQQALTTGPVTGKPTDTILIGALIPKRWAKRSATRNTIRRQIYEMFRKVECTQQKSALVVRLRAEFKPAGFPSASSEALKRAVCAELKQLLLAVSARGSQHS